MSGRSPVISSSIEVTATNHWVSQSDAWITNHVRIGDYVYIIYTASYNPQGTQSGRTYMRRISMSSHTIGAAVEVFPSHILPTPSGVDSSTLLRDAGGSIMALLCYWNAVTEETSGTQCQGTDTVGTARLLVNPDDSGSWGAASPAGGHMRIRLTNTFGSVDCPLTWANGKYLCGYRFFRPSTLYDSNTRTAYLRAATRNMVDTLLDGSPVNVNSMTEVFHRLNSPFSTLTNADGPYVLIEAPSPHSFNPPVTGAGTGQPHSASKLFMGRETSGPKTLYLLWFYRVEFPYTGSPSPSGALWTYDLHLAKSTDKGVTWSNLSGHYSRTATSRIGLTDSAYRVLIGDYRAEYNEWGADVDLDGNIHLLLHRYPGNPVPYYTPGTTHLDWYAINVASFDGTPMNLIYARISPDGSVYENPTPLMSKPNGFLPQRIHIVTGRPGELFVISEQPLEYNYSRDNGVTWDDWVNIGGGNDRLFAQISRDSEDPTLIHLIYHTFTTLNENKLHWRSVTLGTDPQQIEPIYQTYEDVRVQGNSFGIHQVQLTSDFNSVKVPILADQITPANSVTKLDDGTDDRGVTISASEKDTIILSGGTVGSTVWFMTRHRGRLNYVEGV